MQTWENNGKPESQDPIPRETAMLENPKIKEYLDIKVISGEANEDTYEKLGEFETALKKRVVAFIKKAPLNGVKGWKIIFLMMSGKHYQTRELRKCCWRV